MTSATDEPYGLPGVAGPWLGDMDLAARVHGERLAALRDRRLTRTWVVWDLIGERWFPDGPIVLDFERERLEFAATRSDEIFLGWNTMDVTVPIGWSTEQLDLVWREDGLEVLSRHRGSWVTDARVARDPNGIALALETGELRIFNACDEVGVREARRPSRLVALIDRAARAIHDRRAPLRRWSSAIILALLLWRWLAGRAANPPF